MTLATANRDLVNDLVEYVRRQGYARGDRLPSIRQLAEALGAGRNAVRDGVLQAQTLGLVKIEPRLGVFVQDPEAALPDGMSQVLERSLTREEHNVFHLMDARLLVELELVRKAAEAGCTEELLPLRQALDTVLICGGDRQAFVEADEAFHLGIASIAGNPVLSAFLRTLLGLLRPIKMSVLLSSPNRERTDREHVELFRSLLEGDPERAQATIRAHLAQGRSLLLDHLRTMPTTGAASPES